jgi:diapolycopene oxygenase
VAQMLDHFVQYVGSSPDESPAILCAIGHMQMEEGIWYPMGGTRAVPEAMVKLATELGVRFHTNTDVAKILTSGSGYESVTGLVTTMGDVHKFDAIVSNEDAIRTHRELLAQTHAARTFEHKRSYEPACSGVVLYLGLNKRYDHLAHHDFVFSRDPHEEFHAIYDMGEPAPDPTCYLACTAGTDRRRVERRCMCWCIRRTCGHTMIGTRCSRRIGR